MAELRTCKFSVALEPTILAALDELVNKECKERSPFLRDLIITTLQEAGLLSHEELVEVLR